MKQLKCFIAAMGLLALSQGAMAQDVLGSAYKSFVKKHKVSAVELKGSEANKRKFKYFINKYSFKISNYDFKDIETLLKAFEKEESKAYNTINITDGDHQGVSSITMQGNVSYVVGELYDNLMLVCISDPKDTTMRYAYALEWNTPKEGEQVSGRLISCYAKRPKGTRETRQEEMETISIPSIGRDFSSGRKIVIQPLNKAYSKVDAERIKESLKKGGISLNDISDIVMNGDVKYIVGKQTLSAKELTSASWLSEFTYLVTLVKKNANKTAAGIYVPSLYDLSKHTEKLDSSDKELAIEELVRVKELLKDNFLIGLIEKTIQNLKK